MSDGVIRAGQAGGGGLWEVIGNTTVSSPVAEVAFTFPVADYALLLSVVKAASLEAPGTPPGFVNIVVSPLVSGGSSTVFNVSLADAAAIGSHMFFLNAPSNQSAGVFEVFGSGPGYDTFANTWDSATGEVAYVGADDAAVAVNIDGGQFTLFGLRTS